MKLGAIIHETQSGKNLELSSKLEDSEAWEATVDGYERTVGMYEVDLRFAKNYFTF